jgi:hypothetical protein
VYVEHELSFQSILWCAKSLCVLDHGNTVFVIDKIGIIGTLLFQEVTLWVTLRGDKYILYLFTEIGYKASALHQLQFVGSLMLLLGGMTTGSFSTILVALLRRSR